MHVDEHFFDTIKTLFILPRLSFTFAVNFIKGEIIFPIQHFILSTWYHEYIEKKKLFISSQSFNEEN